MKSVTGAKFKLFIVGLNAICMRKKIENHLFIIDNAKIHDYCEIITAIE